MRNTTHLLNKPSPEALSSHAVSVYESFYESFCRAHPYHNRYRDNCRREFTNNTLAVSQKTVAKNHTDHKTAEI